VPEIGHDVKVLTPDGSPFVGLSRVLRKSAVAGLVGKGPLRQACEDVGLPMIL
jgi:hypothetical protein